MEKHNKLNLLFVQKELKKRGLSLFSPKEFERTFDVAETAAKQFIFTYTKKNFFSKLRNGLYSIEGQRPNLYLSANKIYRPSYVSLETALSYYGMIPETVYSITSVTPKPTRQFETFGIDFRYTRIKQSAYTGYTTKQDPQSGSTFLIAEPEKALADYLYLVSLGKKTLNDRLSIRNIDRKKTEGYAKTFHRKGLSAVIETTWNLPEPEIL